MQSWRELDLAGDSAAAQASQGEQAGVVPPPHKALGHQLVQLALAQHIVAHVQARVLPHHGLVLL